MHYKYNCVLICNFRALGQRHMSMVKFYRLVEHVLHQPKPITFYHDITMDTNKKKTTFLLDIEMVRL